MPRKFKGGSPNSNENLYLFLLLILVGGIFLYFIIYKMTPAPSSTSVVTTTIPSSATSKYIIIPPSPPPQYTNIMGITTRSSTDIFNDPYVPPLKNSLDTPISTRMYIPPPIPTRGYDTSFEQVGILTATKNEGQSVANSLILPIMGRKTLNSRDKYQYYTLSNTGMISTKLPIMKHGKSCINEYGCNELTDGDIVYVKGYNDTFRVSIYDNINFQYIPI